MSLPILKAAELNLDTLLKLYNRLDALIDRRETENTSMLTYMDGLSEVHIELMHLIQGRDI